MTSLNDMSFEVFRADAKKLSDWEVDELLSEVPAWRLLRGDGVDQLQREFTFANFIDAMAFSVKTGQLAEMFDHHPSILTEWGKVTVSWWTHKIGGLHKNDFIMASKTDAIIPP